MDKLAQQDSPLLTTQIGSEPLVKGVWDKYFSTHHAKIVRLLRANIKNEPGLQAALTSVFPGFSWPEFADMPYKNTLEGIKGTLDHLMSIPQVKQAAGMENAIQQFIDQYNAMIKQLSQPQAASKAPPTKKRPIQPSPKVKKLQELLGVPSTGLWNIQTNTAFLNWLKANGWDKYIVNNRFTGKIDDAITTMLTERASPEAAPASETATPRQADRLTRLKKLADV